MQEGYLLINLRPKSIKYWRLNAAMEFKTVEYCYISGGFSYNNASAVHRTLHYRTYKNAWRIA